MDSELESNPFWKKWLAPRTPQWHPFRDCVFYKTGTLQAVNFETSSLKVKDYVVGDQYLVDFYRQNRLDWKATINRINQDLNKRIKVEWRKVNASLLQGLKNPPQIQEDNRDDQA